MLPSVPKLAATIERLETRLSRKNRADAWFLTWQSMVGAIHSLAQAERLLQVGRRPKFSQVRAESLLVLRRIIQGADTQQYDFWELGYFLVSGELRVQAATHRLLKTYARRRGRVDALPLVREILLGCANCGHKAPLTTHVVEILKGFRPDTTPRLGSWGPGVALTSTWRWANAYKHDERHAGRDRWTFRTRWRRAKGALHEVALLFEDMGTRRGALTAGA